MGFVQMVKLLLLILLLCLLFSILIIKRLIILLNFNKVLVLKIVIQENV